MDDPIDKDHRRLEAVEGEVVADYQVSVSEPGYVRVRGYSTEQRLFCQSIQLFLNAGQQAFCGSGIVGRNVLVDLGQILLCKTEESN
jgi:hypothetical protein